ncbi:Wadjet anti-phage system protein JetA family protein [Arenibaculum sp.]|jgi:hypothetical protein|uniref:Wadjet anti-phage system protein JetA family protein n=1 Tax=Arenibaculum sp. TaxID=2865862 RepID=UPI002E13B610|nr:Wadjet anti-phage system protein JetA family protein [Arenibaculum sp.]
MALFGQLDEDAFLVFSRKNRRLYAEAILRVYREFFGGSRILVPTRDDVVESLRALLRQRPDLWTEPEDLPGDHIDDQRTYGSLKIPDDEVGRMAVHVYARLLRASWIEEEPHGFNAVVEMPPAVLALADQFDAIERGLPQMFGGVIIDIRTSLQALLADAGANALGLAEAAANAIRFTRRLRAILSSLRGVRREIVGGGDIRRRIDAFFDEFIERILVKDYKAVFTYANHPLRFRGEVVLMAGEIARDPARVRDIAEAYVANGVCADAATAERDVHEQLRTIEEVFENLSGFVARIESFRMQLERRLRNTVRYMESSDDSLVDRTAALIRRIEAARHRFEALGREEPHWPSALAARPRILSGDGLAQPKAARQPVARRAVRRREDDAVEAFRDRLSEWYEARLEPDDRAVADFLDRSVPPAGTQGRHMEIADLDGFAAFERVLDIAGDGGGTLDGRYEIAPAEGRHASDWIDAPNFVVRPKGK